MSGIIYALDIFIAIAFFSVLALVIQRKFRDDLKPSKKHPQGQLIAEFWEEHGGRQHFLVEIQANGHEIKSPFKNENPRYFFTQSSVHTTRYPQWMPFSQLQTDAKIVSWVRNNPEPIDPKRYAEGKHIPEMTAQGFGLVSDTDDLVGAEAVNEEMRKREEELMKANANRLDKRVIYILLGLACAGAVVAAVFAFRVYDIVQPLMTSGAQ
jgi:hypothetical protein